MRTLRSVYKTYVDVVHFGTLERGRLVSDRDQHNEEDVLDVDLKTLEENATPKQK